jgi:hypothetical protein
VLLLLIVVTNMILFIAFIPETKNCSLIDYMPTKRERLFRAGGTGKPLLRTKEPGNPPKNNSAAGLVDEL